MAYRRMTRMISFRVSEDEFERLRSKSQAEGARSVSDYARLALSRDTTGEGEWRDHLQRLSSEVHRLTQLLDPPRQQSPFQERQALSVAPKKAWRNS